MTHDTSLQLVTFEQAKYLQAIDFDWPTDNEFDDGQTVTYEGVYSRPPIPRPTVALALKWMRDVHHLSGEVFANACGWAWEITKCPTENSGGGTTVRELGWDGPNDGGAFDTYEEAERALLSEMLNLIGISKLVKR